MDPTGGLPADPRPQHAVGHDRGLETAGTFADLVCADPDLLHTEFDAIITANWPAPPATTRAAACPPPPDPSRPRDRTAVQQPRADGARHPGHDGRARQRSPPGH